MGQLAWIVEKFKEWTDPAAALPEEAVGLDALLDNVSLYWFTGTSGPSANLYYEAFNDPSAWAPKSRGTVPMAVAVSLTQDVAVRRLAERDHHIVRWTELARGGRFPGDGDARGAGRRSAGVLRFAVPVSLPAAHAQLGPGQTGSGGEFGAGTEPVGHAPALRLPGAGAATRPGGGAGRVEARTDAARSYAARAYLLRSSFTTRVPAM